MIPGISDNKYKNTYTPCKSCNFFSRDFCYLNDRPTRTHFTCEHFEQKETDKDDKKKD